MTLRILFTLAILAGLAAAPSAQSFTWDAGSDWDLRISVDERLVERIERAAERAADRFARAATRLSDRAEHRLERLAWRAERKAERLSHRIESMVERRARAIARGYGATRWTGTAQGAFDDNPCDRNQWGDNDGYRHCEVREERLPAGPLSVDAGRNGGIRVEGWDGNEILVRAVVQTNGRDEATARQLASAVQVQVQAGGGRVTATGPDTTNREWWSVSYRIRVPRQNDLQLNARNGGISVTNVTGTIAFDTVNGGVQLADLGGRVNGRTRNGGVKVALGGSQWDGEGLDVETSNGGVTIAVPEVYNAELETRTVNGGFRSELPLTLTGELSPRRGINTTLGAGGAPVRVRTTNGGVRIEQR